MDDRPPIVIQLQELASDSSNNLSDLLRKALIIATKLNLKDFKRWVLNELNGYENMDELPEYRKIIGELRVHNPYRGYIPFIISNSQLANTLGQILVADSIESINHLVKNSKKGSDLVTFAFSPEQEAILMGMQDGPVQLRPARVLGINYIAAILEKVRTYLLTWSLALEEAGILGEGLTFSKEEKRKAEMNVNIGSITGHQVQLGNNNTQHKKTAKR